MYAYYFEERRYDVGERFRFLELKVEYALRGTEVKEIFGRY